MRREVGEEKGSKRKTVKEKARGESLALHLEAH